MDASPRYILSRAVFFIALLIAVLFGVKFVKKKQRESAIISELETITRDSSFFHQIDPETAHKSLVQAVGLIAEANELGISPPKAINRGMGIKEKFFESDARHDESQPREKVIRGCLLDNYDNFLKLGYKANHQTLDAMSEGKLPPIPSGHYAGKTPVIANVISPTLAPGMENVIANLEIRPPQPENHPPTDLEIAASIRLADDLVECSIIGESVHDKIVKALIPPKPVAPAPPAPDPATPTPPMPDPAAPKIPETEPVAPAPVTPDPVGPQPATPKP